jgi:preprotein translocase subunit SecG
MIIGILTFIHVVMCIALILIVLLQTGKGSELAGAFGGGTSNTAFGVTGAISMVGKMTTVAAFCFLLTSFSLSLLPTGHSSSSIIEEETAPQAPQKAPAAGSSVPGANLPGKPDESGAKGANSSIPAESKDIKVENQKTDANAETADKTSQEAPGNAVQEKPATDSSTASEKSTGSKASDNTSKSDSSAKTDSKADSKGK